MRLISSNICNSFTRTTKNFMILTSWRTETIFQIHVKGGRFAGKVDKCWYIVKEKCRRSESEAILWQVIEKGFISEREYRNHIFELKVLALERNARELTSSLSLYFKQSKSICCQCG